MDGAIRVGGGAFDPLWPQARSSGCPFPLPNEGIFCNNIRRFADLTGRSMRICSQRRPRADRDFWPFWQVENREAEMMEQPEAQPTVFVVDDDASLREALQSLLRSVGLQVALFGSAADFLKVKLPDAAACLVLDIRLPGVSGLDFQAELAKADIQIPIIFITGHGDIPMTVRAMKAGAVEFLTKPFRDQDLLDAVQIAFERDRRRRAQARAVHELRAHFEALTPREQQVIGFVTAGLMNKQIAAELGISEITVKVHRGSVMKKMGARSLADLVRMADTLGIRRAKP
jgi:FixJ family two-component response regulator